MDEQITISILQFVEIVGVLILIFILWCIITRIASYKSSINEPCCDRNCTHLIKKDFLYMGIVATIAIVMLLVLSFASNSDAVNYFSFAGTLSSIILSVVAIFMTISSENNNKAAKTQMDIFLNELKGTTQKVSELSEQWKKSMGGTMEKQDEQKVIFNEILQKSEEILQKSEQILSISQHINESIPNLKTVQKDYSSIETEQWRMDGDDDK